MYRIMLIVLVLLSGCATNARFTGDELPASHISGERVCEVPQHWKALALEGIDTRSLEKASVVQIRVPAEWIGDALGWFVEGEEDRAMEQYPRYVWQAFVMNKRTGEKQFFPAIMKNPLTSPVLTVIIPDRAEPVGEELSIYVSSGAYTKLLTVSGDMLPLPRGKDCLSVVDKEFLREFPSHANSLSVNDTGAGGRLLSGIRMDFPKASLQSDGQVYSINPLALHPQVVGDLRQVTQGERIAERGLAIVIPSVVGTAISVGVALATTGEDLYAGPFGERLYSAPEAEVALGRYLRGYNTLKGELEMYLGMPFSNNTSLPLDWDGRKSGWEIGEYLVPYVKQLWDALDQLKERVSFRTKEKGAVMQKEVVQAGLLPSSSP